MKHLLILSVVIWAVGCLPPDSGISPGPGPSPPEPPRPGDAVMLQVRDEYFTGLSQVFAETAQKIDRGELTTEIEVNQFVHDRSGQIRTDAFMLLNRDAEQIGGDRWSPSVAAQYWRAQAEALR